MMFIREDQMAADGNALVVRYLTDFGEEAQYAIQILITILETGLLKGKVIWNLQNIR